MASKRRIRRKQCGSKIKFPSLGAAIGRARRLEGKFGRMYGYHCRFCNRFHIGH